MAQYSPFPSFIRAAAMKYFSKEYGRDKAGQLMNKTLELYGRFAEEAPDIGGKENKLSNNLYMALAVFAFYETAEKKITPEDMKKMMTEYMPKSLPVVSSIIDFNKPKNQEKIRLRFEKYKALSDEKFGSGQWGNSWRVEINPHGREKGVAFDFIGCPLADFAKSHSYMEIMPVLCEFDYITAALMHARLVREHTVADGSEYCDYWYLGDKEEI
ncbi:MAG: L-2-amino-thiazoline-4-carboxylic acid hydrolase [Oscillospiraceae bacterium]|nr:L-2-amino-thiazoline-4-carboxylic acid hydrolase [Oscillospiraceae bacterium]